MNSNESYQIRLSIPRSLVRSLSSAIEYSVSAFDSRLACRATMTGTALTRALIIRTDTGRCRITCLTVLKLQNLARPCNEGIRSSYIFKIALFLFLWASRFNRCHQLEERRERKDHVLVSLESSIAYLLYALALSSAARLQSSRSERRRP